MSVQKAVQMGIGDAIIRLIRIHRHRTQFGGKPGALTQEEALIIEALNQQKLDLNFDCDEDGVPDTVEIFSQSANTSCCRILPQDTSRRSSVSSEKRAKSKTRRTRSRKKE